MEFIRRNSDYALRSLVYMAHFPKRKVFYLNTVAQEREVPPVFLHKIFQKLSKAKLVISHRGIGGGFSLAKDPSRITAKEIIEILQGSLAFNRCLVTRDACSRVSICSVRKNLHSLQHKFIKSLGELTLSDLVREEKA